MKSNAYRTILGAVAIAVCCAGYGLAQTETGHGANRTHSDVSNTDVSAVTNEPHQILATAYIQSMETFARALSDQGQAGGQLSTDFARAAVDEIRRSMDEAQEQHQAHMKTMGENIHYALPLMMKDMKDADPRWSGLREAVKALENDVQGYTLNGKQIAADSADLLKRLEEMPRIHRPR
jgi:polyhydroxyalkanoate synthesis regulator phasin